jgi:hypothetical protein
MKKAIGRKFSPATALFGLALFAAGGLVLLFHQYVFHWVPHIILIGALLALPAGVGAVLFSFVPACIADNTELQHTKVMLAASGRAALKEAYERGTMKDLLTVISTYTGSQEPGATRLICAYCPKCQAVGYLKVAGWKERPIAGPDVRSVLGLMEA